MLHRVLHITSQRCVNNSIRTFSSIDNSSLYPDAKSRGSIELVCGPMYSGKTTFLIEKMRYYEAEGKKVVLIKHAADTRYLDPANTYENVAHDQVSKFAAIPLHYLKDCLNHSSVLEAEVVGVDEGQFFSDLSESCEILANQGKTVLVGVLDGDYTRKMFPSVVELLPKSDKFTKILAKCRLCKSDAPFSHRTSNETEVQVIGSDDKYMALCRPCYIEQNSAKLNRKE